MAQESARSAVNDWEPSQHGRPAPRARILLLDDEPDIVGLVARQLEGLGFRVDSTRDGSRALEMARTGDYWLIVLDLHTRGLDGVAALRQILAARPHQAVLVIPKPFTLATMVARIRVMGHHEDPRGEERCMRVGRITLDLQRHVADAGAGAVPLSARECELLLHLMLRAGRACSREQLLAAVWNMHFDPRTNVVDVYVRRLRRKLGADAIETRRNVGYALRAI